MRKNDFARRALALCCLCVWLLAGARAESVPSVYTADAVLYVPDFDSAALVEKPLTAIEVPASGTLEQTLLDLLLEEIAANADGQYEALRDIGLMPPGCVRSRDVAVIHLTGEAETLDPLSRFTLCQAITGTVCGPGAIRACLILSDGHALAMGEAGSIPAGVFIPNAYSDSLTALSQLFLRRPDDSASAQYRGTAALFFPTSAGHGIVCDTRALTFAADAPEENVLTILRALSGTDLFDIPQVPDLTAFLTEPPAVTVGDDGTRLLVLRFDATLTEELSGRGILRSVMMASITFSIQCYLPWVDGIRCEIGGEPILGIVPVGLYDGANEAISFERGYMLWQDFAHFLLTDVRLYFMDDQRRLTQTSRYIPAVWATDPMRLLSQLFVGPTYYDETSGLRAIYETPEALEETLTGISSGQDLLTLDFSEPFWISSAHDLRDEQNAVYALVNTLTDLPWCSRILLTVKGSAPKGLLSYDTAFMRSADYQSP